LEHTGPVYLRLTRQKLDDVNAPEYRFELGKAVVLREGDGVALFGTGATVQESLKAADRLVEDGIEARVVNAHTLSPIDREAILDAARTCDLIVTAEDHNVHGGLGSAVAEVLAEAGAGVPLTVLGARDYGQSGTSEELFDAYGISAAHIADAARASLRSG
jgi:transketolase